jgi:hypothetical protein
VQIHTSLHATVSAAIFERCVLLFLVTELAVLSHFLAGVGLLGVQVVVAPETAGVIDMAEMVPNRIGARVGGQLMSVPNSTVR